MHPSTARERIAEDRVLVVAHRGDSRVAPENTLPAFRSALALGVDFVELDYLHSADGVPMVFHDRELDRTTNARAAWKAEHIALAGKTSTELRTLDAGSWFGPAFRGTQIPTLEEALDVIQPTAMTVIERKSGDAETLVALLRRKRAIEHVALESFDWDFLEACHRLAPELALVAIGDEELTDAKLAAAERTGCVAIGWDDRRLTPSGVGLIKRRRWKAWVWTADVPERWRELASMGVTGITTNCPGPLVEMLAGRKL